MLWTKPVFPWDWTLNFLILLFSTPKLGLYPSFSLISCQTELKSIAGTSPLNKWQLLVRYKITNIMELGMRPPFCSLWAFHGSWHARSEVAYSEFSISFFVAPLEIVSTVFPGNWPVKITCTTLHLYMALWLTAILLGLFSSRLFCEGCAVWRLFYGVH